MPLDLVPLVDVRIDPRFSIEYNWENEAIPNIKECQERGIIITPITVFNSDGEIEGWLLEGWEPAPAKILYKGN